MFWVWRIDLLTLPFFVAGAVAVIFGVQGAVAAEGRSGLSAPGVDLSRTRSVLLGRLERVHHGDVVRHHKILNVVHVATPVGGLNNAVFTVVHNGHPSTSA